MATKMIGVGQLVAGEILGSESELLKPFRFNRYEKDELHPNIEQSFSMELNLQCGHEFNYQLTFIL